MSNKQVKRKDRSWNQTQNAMSSKTREFLQKICYKKTASVDMTQYGFARDSIMMLKPVEFKMEEICGTKIRKRRNIHPKTKTKTKTKNFLQEDYVKVLEKGDLKYKK